MSRSNILDLTRGELLAVLESRYDSLWDDRYWLLSLKSDKPVEVYQEILRERRTAASTPSVDELPPEQQAWLRASK